MDARCVNIETLCKTASAYPLGIIFNKLRNEPPAHLRQAVAAARANAASIARERIPDPRGPYCPIVGFKGCFPDHSSGPRERTSFQRAAQHNGWCQTFEWFDANPDRKFYVRPALQGENRNGDEPSHWTLVCAKRNDGGTFEQRVIDTPAQQLARDLWPVDKGESSARTVFHGALCGSIKVQSMWTVGRSANGPIILGMERGQ